MKIKTIATILLIACNTGTVKIHAMKMEVKLKDCNKKKQRSKVPDNIQRTRNIKKFKKLTKKIIDIGNSGKQPKELVKKSKSLKKININTNQLTKKQKSNLLEFIDEKIKEIRFSCTFTMTVTDRVLSIYKNKKDPQYKIGELCINVKLKNTEKNKKYTHPKDPWINFKSILRPISSVHQKLTKELAPEPEYD